MLPLSSSRVFFRKSDWFVLLVLIFFLLVPRVSVEAQATAKKNKTSKENTGKTLFETLKANPWSNIKGFRSAKFGINEKSVYRAIAKDFKIGRSKVKKATHPTEKTTVLEIMVPDLYSTGGTARVGYFLGHKSKKLTQVSVLWGKGVAKNVDGRAVVDVANQLRAHFLKKQYKKKGLAANVRYSDTQTVIFRGRDQKDSVIVLILNSPASKEGMSQEDQLKQITLNLSYLFNPDNPDIRKPDIRKMVIGEDEF